MAINTGLIQNCYVHGTTVKAAISRESAVINVGGVAGFNQGTVRCCYISDSAVSGQARVGWNVAHTGGIVGDNIKKGSIDNCYSTAEVTGTSTRGTVCGYNSGTIKRCYYVGDQGVGAEYGGSQTDTTAKTASEIGSPEFAAELEHNCPDCSWEQKAGNLGRRQVVLTMQNLTVTPSHASGNCQMPIMVSFTSDRAPDSDQLYYSIDGVTEGRKPYTDPIPLEQDAVIRVYAVCGDHPEVCRVSTFRYKAAKYPVEASPAPGTYTTARQTITLTTQTPGAEIYYTLDGTTPTDDSTRYSRSFRISKNTTVTAAAKVGDEWGDPMRFTYKISPEITADKPAGSYTEPFTVKLMSTVPEYEIYYTVDDYSDPTVDGTKYDPDQGIEIYKTTTLRVASTFEEEWSDVTTFQYDFPTPVITPSVKAGEHSDVVHLTLECDTPYVTLSYLAPGMIEQETPYRPGETIDIYKTAALTVYAKYEGQQVTQEIWEYILPEPEIIAEPEAGTYNAVQTITLRSNIPSYEIYYTLDGSDPVTEGLPYTEPFELDHSADLKVCAKYGEHVVKTDSFGYDLSAVPSVTADPAAGDITAPNTITLTAPFYTIYYTTDGSDPKTSPTSSSGDGKVQIPIEDPEPITIRAVPEWDGNYGTTSTFRYTFNSQKLAMEKTRIEKRTDYEITFTVTNTLPKDKTVDLYAAAYQNGKMLGSSVEPMELPSGTEKKSVTLHYASVDQLPAEAQFKVFCLDSESRRPYCEPLTYEVSEAAVFQELSSITVEPASIVGQVGEELNPPTVTAHYTNGKPDAVVTADITPDHNVVTGSSKLMIQKEGSGFITVSYSEGGITKSVKMPVTGVPPVVNLGFLANPEADSLPEGAIPISSAEDLAAIKSEESVGKTYYLTNDIQLTGEWKPVYGFQGTLDGRGHKVSGLYVSAASKQMLAGLFASAYDAVIKNLSVEIDPRGVSAYNETSNFDMTCAGGLVGHSKNTDFINCYTTGGPVSATGAAPCAGGLVGYLMNKEENRLRSCFSNCAVSCRANKATYSGTCIAGGLIGDLESGDKQSEYQTKSNTVSRCYATGNVSVNHPGGGGTGGGIRVGGLIGYGNYLRIFDCFALGDVSAKRDIPAIFPGIYAGGLCGWLVDAHLAACYAAGDVTGAADSHVGGLTTVSTNISNCYRVQQNVTGTNRYDGGTAISKGNVQSSYRNFDFIDTWQFTEGTFRGLPHLQYQD